MVPKSPESSMDAAAMLKALGAAIRAQRKVMRVSSTAAAEAAGVSRVTLHRIERGAPSVAIGAWADVLRALGLQARVVDAMQVAPEQGWIPTRIDLSRYPQLKAVSRHIHGAHILTPKEAFASYERNKRHLDVDAMTKDERALFEALQVGFGSV